MSAVEYGDSGSPIHTDASIPLKVTIANIFSVDHLHFRQNLSYWAYTKSCYVISSLNCVFLRYAAHSLFEDECCRDGVVQRT